MMDEALLLTIGPPTENVRERFKSPFNQIFKDGVPVEPGPARIFLAEYACEWASEQTTPLPRRNAGLIFVAAVLAWVREEWEGWDKLQAAVEDLCKDAELSANAREFAQAVIDGAINPMKNARRACDPIVQVSPASDPTAMADLQRDQEDFAKRMREVLRALSNATGANLFRHTDLPMHGRLFVEDIDSFRKVRDINPSVVALALRKGRVDLLEEQVQLAFEQILDVPFHRRDWGGESNDLYTANVIINGARIPTAFILKGRGCTSPELRIADCGTNGDQILRLLDSPADLFVIQYVGPVSDAVIKDIEGKTNELRLRGRNAYYCVIDGQDTARVLQAYGKLPVSPAN